MRPRAFFPSLLLVLAFSAGLVGSWGSNSAFADPVDTDADGIADTEDLCLHEPGPAGNDGCPDVDAPFIGEAGTKLNVATPIRLPATVSIDTGAGFAAWGASTSAAQGAIRFDTRNTTAWKAPLKTAANTWTVTTKAANAMSAGVFINGQWRPLQVGTTLTIKVAPNGGTLYFKFAGMAPNGVGTNRVSVEAESVGGGLTGPLKVVSHTPAHEALTGTSPVIAVTFNSPLAGFAAGEASLDCGSGATTFASASIAGNTATLTPSAPIPQGANCTVHIQAGAPSDLDANDPPDGLLADYFFSFETDVAPAVQFINPTNGSVIPGSSFVVAVAFTEPVSLDAGAVTITGCGQNHVSAARVSAGQYYNYQAEGALPGETCTITVTGSKVHDGDTADAPDTMPANVTSTFTIEAPPVMSITLPAAGAVTGTSPTIWIEPSEHVTLLDGAITVTGCASYSSSANNTNTAKYVIPITATAGTTCTVTVHRLLVSDVDGIGEEHPIADTTLEFTVDQAPTIVSTELVDDNSDSSDTMDPTGHIRITYSEPVQVGQFGAWSLTCETAVVPMTVSSDPNDNTVIIARPTDSTVAALHGGPECTFTMGAAIVDRDTADPPNTAPGFVLEFHVNEVAPFIVNISQIENTFDPQDPFWVLVVNFSEPINWNYGGMHASCGVGGTEIFFGGPSMDGRTFVYSEQYAEPCDFTITASLVYDVDTNDGPNLLVAGATFEFPGVVWP